MLDVTAPWPFFSDDEISAVEAVLRSGKVNYWTGEIGKNFEKAFAEFHQAKYGVAVANGTVALELALWALDVGEGDEVIVTPRTFLASASSIRMRGATPVFVDVDVDSQNITPETIQAALTPKTKAVICVHLAGWPCEMDRIMALAEKHHFYVIEDCAQAHGAKFKGKRVGSWGHINAFSFCQDKIMTTGGEGGFVTTNDETLWKRAWSLKDHGKNYDTVFNKSHPPGFRWLHERLGTNWRLTEMQSAIGVKQLEKLPEWLNKRRQFSQMYTEALAPFEAVRVPMPATDVSHSRYKYYFFIKPDKLADGWSRDRIIHEVVAGGLPCYSGSCSEIYLEKCFDNTGMRPADVLPVAHALGETSVMLLVHPTLTEEKIKMAVSILTQVLSQASK